MGNRFKRSLRLTLPVIDLQLPPTAGAEGSAAGDRGGRAPLDLAQGAATGHSAATGRACIAVDDAPHRIRPLVNGDTDPGTGSAL